MNVPRLMALLASVVLLSGACGGGSEEPTEESGSSESSESSEHGADALPVTVTAKKFAFDRDTVEAHATHTVDLTFVNEDDVEHSFTIDELEVDVEAHGGEEATATFTPEEIGTFDFYCRYHPDTMMGTVEVT